MDGWVLWVGSRAGAWAAGRCEGNNGRVGPCGCGGEGSGGANAGGGGGGGGGSGSGNCGGGGNVVVAVVLLLLLLLLPQLLCGQHRYWVRSLPFSNAVVSFPASQRQRRHRDAFTERTRRGSPLQESVTVAPHRSIMATCARATSLGGCQRLHGQGLQDREQRLAFCKLGAEPFCEAS